MNRYEQFCRCLNKVLLLKLLQKVAISIQCVIWFNQNVENLFSDQKKFFGPAFASANFVMILIFF